MPAVNSQRRYINQLKAGETLDQVFLVREKDLRTAKTGSQYIQCTLCDKTGAIPARMWQATEAIFNAIPTEGFLHVKGRTEEYRGSLQIIIDACRPFAAEKIDIGDFMPVTELDVEEMWAELLEIIRAVKDKHLRLLIKKFVEDRELVAGFKKAPAAIQMHHPFVGGLLEHTLNVARAARALLPLYPKLNADLVLAGVFLHDIGKIAELSAGVAMTYTDRGLLIGHITIGAMWVQEKAGALAAETSEPFPQRTLDLLQHIILSHHGVYEYGSPKLPAVPEAFFIHYLDNLDAKMFITLHAIANDPDQEASFTGYLRQIETKIFKRSGELQ
ncbi:MAG TPA: HD domain-containing protein [Phycisphaerae bacterium]|nr:HD domain-containing protein [Phycisphaerae bacterium]